MKMKIKLSFLLFATPLLLMSCEGSRSRRMYETGKAIYEDYEETGDPTWLIGFIILLLIIGVLWLLNKNKDD